MLVVQAAGFRASFCVDLHDADVQPNRVDTPPLALPAHAGGDLIEGIEGAAVHVARLGANNDRPSALLELARAPRLASGPARRAHGCRQPQRLELAQLPRDGLAVGAGSDGALAERSTIAFGMFRHPLPQPCLFARR